MDQRKVYEISFNIAGQMASNFKGAFSSASFQVHQLKRELADLSEQYRRGDINTERYQTEHKRLTRQLDQTHRAQNRVNSSMQRQNAILTKSQAIAASIGNKVMFGVKAGMIAGIGGAAAVTVKSFREAAQFELNSTQIEAMFGANQQLAQRYIQSLEKMALDSPILDSQQMYANSKGFISVLKSTKEAEKNLMRAWSITEKLAAMDPIQGTEGAAFALKELLSGDAVSLIERFELSRNELNEIKKLKPEKALEALEKYLNKLGITEEFIAKSAGTAVGQWNQMNEKINVGLREMGKQGLEKIKPELEEFNKWLEGPTAGKIIDLGSDIIAGFTDSAIQGVHLASQYISTRFINNPAFQKLSIGDKAGFIVGDLLGSFNGWLDAGGQEKINEVGSTMISILAKIIEDGAPRLGEAGAKVGVAIGGSIMSEMMDIMKENPIGAMIVGAIPTAAVGSLFGPAGTAIGGGIGSVAALGTWGVNQIVEAIGNIIDWNQASEKIESGSRPVTINATFAPVINSRGEMIIPELQKQQKDFTKELEAIMHQKRRVSFGD